MSAASENVPRGGSSAPYPEKAVEFVTLKDGLQVKIRPIRPDDAPLLQEGFRRLSPQTVYLRFLDTFKELSDSQARQFAELDYQTRMALVAEIRDQGRNILIGVARYALVGDPEAGTAECAVVVQDEYQKRGLGTILLNRLIDYAQTHGVKAFLATVHMSNAQILHFVRRSGFRSEKRIFEPGVWEVTIHLGEPAGSPT